ncbi:hypothetical protein PBI_SCTP2_38 [Salicola phage SCTP-2]|nr:hypothetical protein PBI_SCTP2_38 [Salicola phage SCTP-2]
MEHYGDTNTTEDNSIITLLILSFIMGVVFHTYGGKITGSDLLEKESQKTYVSESGTRIINKTSKSTLKQKTYPKSIFDK